MIKLIKTLISKNKFLLSVGESVYFKITKKSNFNSKNYWKKRYTSGGNSGDGSYGNLSKFKAQIINDFISKNKVQNVIEFGCGDGNQLSLFKIAQYIGLDVSKKSIELCQTKFNKDKNKSFFLYDSDCFTDNFKIFNSNLTLSLDVIYHLIEDDTFNKYMQDLFATSNKYVIIYSSNQNQQKKYQAQHVFHRKFSDYIKKNLPEWKLKEKIKNKYPKESFADFFIYQKESK